MTFARNIQAHTPPRENGHALTVKRAYMSTGHDVVCVDDDGNERYVDLFVDGTLPNEYQTAEDLIGMVVEVDYLTPHIEIASNPRVITKPRQKT
jgi:hypothetical protein